MSGTRVLVVEDHPLFRDGFAAMAAALRPAWRLCFATTGREAAARIDEGVVDVAVVDVGLPEEDGFAVAAMLGLLRPGLPIVMISGRGEPALHQRARGAGAKGFVMKSEDASAIAGAVDTVAGGGEAFVGAGAMPGAVPVLTPRQAQVLALLADGHGNKEIRHRLGIAERTVRAHLTELFHVLGAHSRTQAMVRARALGLIG